MSERRDRPVCILAAGLAAFALATGSAAQERGTDGPPHLHAPEYSAVRSPEGAFGFRIGEDGRLLEWAEIVRYLEQVADASPRVRLEEIGRSVQGRRMVMAVITSPSNQARLDEIRRAQAVLADPRGVSETERARLIREQPAVVFIGASIHGTELMGSQMSAELVFELATDPRHAEALE